MLKGSQVSCVGFSPADNILAIHSLNPPSLLGHYTLYRTLMYDRSPLSRIERESIAVAVSVRNECHY